MTPLSEIDSIFVDFCRHMGSFSGMDSLSSTIIGILYMQPGDMAMEDIAEKTGYSLASISNKVKVLEQRGIIMRKSKPGTRKAFLYMDKDLFRMLKNQLVFTYEKKMQAIKVHMPLIIANFKEKAKTKEDKEKVKILENYNKQVILMEQAMVRMIDKIDEIKNEK